MKQTIQNIDKITIGFIVLLAIGIFLRIFKLGLLPIGLNADEASIGYEAYSLLKTGADRWGIKLPPYFLAFGSGQNTLYAYLSVPFLYFFDLSQTSIRYLSAFLGLATVPLVYLLAKLIFKNRYFVLACTILYLFDPYLFMISRWALEINILPFFTILSLYFFTKTFSNLNFGSQSSANKKLDFSNKLILVATFPSLAFIIYAYASALFILPVFISLILVYYWREICREKWLFAVSILLLLLFLSPFILYILKNNILKTDLAFEQYLPFEIPKMLSNREEVFKGISGNLAIIKKNFIFIFSGFKEFDRTFNTTKFYNPHLFLLFSVLGLVFLTNQVVKRANKHLAPIVFWSISCFVPFLFFEMNLNRSVHLQAVIPILSVVGLFVLYENIVDLNYKKYLIIGVFGLVSIQSVLFYGEYFNRFPTYDQFILNFEPAIKAANANKKTDEKIVITSYLVFNYLFVNFYEKYPPAQFHKTLKAEFLHPNVAVQSYEGYYMLGDMANTGYYLNLEVFEKVKKEKSFVVLLLGNEKISGYEIDGKSLIDTTLYNQNTVHQSDQWKVVRFEKK